LTVAYIEVGEAAAREEAAEVLRINPRFSMEESMQRGRYLIKDQTLRERFRADLSKAGLK